MSMRWPFFLGTHVRLVAMREFLISTLVLASSAQQYPWNLEADYTTSTTAGFLPGFSDGARAFAAARDGIQAFRGHFGSRKLEKTRENLEN